MVRSWSPGRVLVGAGVVVALLGGAACSSSSEHAAGDRCNGQAQSPIRTCPQADTVPGIDVSSYQGTVDWNAVRASGKEFTFIRTVKRDTTVDTDFSANWKGAKSAGVLRGPYLFFAPSVDVDKQLTALAAALDAEGGLAPGDLPVVLDVEVDDMLPIATVAARAADWLTKAEARFGIKPLVYTSASFATPMNGALASWSLWVANYKVTCPDLPGGWTTFAFWQSGQGTTPGIAGAVDVNVFNGTRAQLDELLVGVPAAPDAGGPPEAAPPPAEDAAPPPPPPPCL